MRKTHFNNVSFRKSPRCVLFTNLHDQFECLNNCFSSPPRIARVDVVVGGSNHDWKKDTSNCGFSCVKIFKNLTSENQTFWRRNDHGSRFATPVFWAPHLSQVGHEWTPRGKKLGPQMEYRRRKFWHLLCYLSVILSVSPLQSNTSVCS